MITGLVVLERVTMCQQLKDAKKREWPKGREHYNKEQ